MLTLMVWCKTESVSRSNIIIYLILLYIVYTKGTFYIHNSYKCIFHTSCFVLIKLIQINTFI